MTVTIVGAQLGDEGKGGIVDLYGEPADIVARYQGGDNAGHTVVHGGEEYKLSLVPSGVVRGKTGVLGNGCVVNPRTLFEEIDTLRDRGLDPDVRVARRAHVIFPYHRRLDGIEEEAKSETDQEVGTTGRGIGPTYEDKAGRRGIRVGDLANPSVLREQLEYTVPQKRALAEDVFGVDAGEVFGVIYAGDTAEEEGEEDEVKEQEEISEEQTAGEEKEEDVEGGEDVVTHDLNSEDGDERVKVESGEGEKLLKITEPVDRFMGTDDKEYGPLERGDLVTLPEDVAELLLEKEKAEESEL